MMDDAERTVEPVIESGASAVEAPEAQPLSKKAIKRAAKAERYAAHKLERRAREKEAKKEKKRAIAAKRAAGEFDEDEERKRQKKRPRLHFGGKVVVDLGFDDKMNEKEIVSLCSQLAYTYSANRNAAYPFSLLYTSLNGRTLTRLESMNDAGYRRWVNTEWWHEGYERLWQGQDVPPPSGDSQAGEADRKKASTAPSGPAVGEDSRSQQDIKQKIVYLTADSEEELTELQPEETYIIGGICDHNRYKNLCLDKAKESGIRTARLPIGRYLASLPTRKVLTVNQVFEILLKWVETKDWEQALYSVIPKRKFHAVGKAGSDATKNGSQAGDAEDEKERQEAVEQEDPSSTVVEKQEQDADGDR
ncbi:putative tRNA (Guanine-1)-methyltransferase [Lyophyllum shimeji]|uniref:tRNA (guanine(9)-N1)-methyltransferase n=1 Tax=Lyophyllum shimeji TaxID=47721 RepID=A0A9P3PER9_LYOSH|nr:putative tRNA (Guanine-1)-methyltransferase [Lyophyllum shimeji]